MSILEAHPRTERRMVHMHRLEKVAPERFCWADLVYVALFDNELSELSPPTRCKKDAEDDGHCYCGKFVRVGDRVELSAMTEPQP